MNICTKSTLKALDSKRSLILPGVPMTICGVTLLDMGVMAIGGFVLWTFSYTKLTVERWEGAVLTAAYIGYTWWLISNL